MATEELSLDQAPPLALRMAQASTYVYEVFVGAPADSCLVAWRKRDRLASWIPVASSGTISGLAISSVQEDLYVGVTPKHRRDAVDPVTGEVTREAPPFRSWTDRRGTAGDTSAVTCLWADVDTADGIHTADGLPTRDEAMAALQATGLDLLIVDSGGGYQPYVLLAEPVEPEVGAALERRFLGLLRERLREVAPGCNMAGAIDSVGDLARVLRVPGTWNTKGGDRRPVTIVNWSTSRSWRRYSAAELDEILPAAEPQRRTAPRTHTTHTDRKADADADLVARECSFVRHCVDDAETLPEPEWYHGTIGIGAYCRDGEAVAHRWSAPYPRYSAEETDDKIAHHLQDAGAPTTCTYIADGLGWEGCRECPWRGKVTSPVQLGRRDRSETEPVPAPRRDPKRFFDGRGKFQPDALVQHLKIEHDFAYAGEQWYLYEAGAYRAVDEARIKQLISDELLHKRRVSMVNEVTELLRIDVHLRPEDMNRRPDLINVRNGMLEWKTGELLPHDPQYRSTIQLPVEYDPEADCPEIDRFLGQVLPDEVAKELIYEWAGYCTGPLTFADAFLLPYGSGANGKSVLTGVLQAFVGAENTAAETMERLDGNRFATASLYGKLLNASTEISHDQRVLQSTGMLKRIVSGDPIPAERKNRDAFQFRPFAKLMFSTNALPKTTDTTDGFFRRVIPLELPHTFKGDGVERREELLARLTSPQELSGLLNRAIEGLRRLHARGRFRLPESSQALLARYKLESDTVAQFVEESCVVDEGKHTVRSRWYQAYRLWCQDHGYRPLNAANAYNQLEVLGFRRDQTPGKGSKRIFRGLDLRPDIFED